MYNLYIFCMLCSIPVTLGEGSSCPEQKTVGDICYERDEEDVDTSSYECTANCTYKKKDYSDDDERFCFKPGDLPVTDGCVDTGPDVNPTDDLIPTVSDQEYLSCFDDNTAYSYGEYIVAGVENFQPTKYDCQKSCSVHNTCNFWTWGKKGTQVYGRCYLKIRKTIPGVQLDYPDYISGPKFCGENIVTRKNSDSLNQDEVAALNKALQLVKESKSSGSFTDIATYHGLPQQCNKNQTGIRQEGTEGNGCCIPHWGQYDEAHHSSGKRNRIVLFGAWHRLYVYQLEKALRIAFQNLGQNAIGVPYWDWTAVHNDDEELLKLPSLAQQGEWMNGPINKELNFKFGSKKDVSITSRNPGAKPPQCKPVTYKDLRNDVKLAYRQTDFKSFNSQINIPHGRIHVWTGGNMATKETSSYDPIFFLHHSNVDFQYAYFQELQKLRKKPLKYGVSKIDGDLSSFSMYPFASSIKNPFPISQQHSTGPQGEDYKRIFSYQYDNLLFEGLTPQQLFDQQNEENKQPMLFAGIFKKHTGISSLICVDSLYNNTPIDGGSFVTYTYGSTTENPNFTSSHVKNVLLYDATSTFSDIVGPVGEKSHKFVVTKYTDVFGNDLPINETYQPIVIYKEANSSSHIHRLHVEHIHEYAPVMYGRIGHHVEFLKNGQVVSGHDDVKTLVGGTDDDYQIVNGTTPIEYQQHNFLVKNEYGETNFILGYDLDTFEGNVVNNSRRSLLSGNQIIPWKLDWLKKNPNVYTTNCPETKIMITSSDETLSMVTKVDKTDYDSCTNLWTRGSDGIYGLLVDTRVPGSYYYAEGKKTGSSSQNYCNLGWKIAVHVSDCQEK